jgi:plasmid stabilization system protein ParE
MKVNYAPRARADLAEIAEYSRKAFGSTVASALETYMRATIARIAAMPESGVSVTEREGGAGRAARALSLQDILFGVRGHRDDSACAPHGSKAVVVFGDFRTNGGTPHPNAD